VPASLIGLDLDPFLASASATLALCRDPEPQANPGLLLGLAMGSLARGGRDKLTFVADPATASFGSWAEQLIAESTGKQGTGIVPIDREPLGPAKAYGGDRVFVGLGLAPGDGESPSAEQSANEELLDELAKVGHPVIRIEIDDPIDLAGEMVRWEVATAFAGAVLGIDPFDQPNVEEAKERTRELLSGGGPAAAGSAGGPADGATQGHPVVREDRQPIEPPNEFEPIGDGVRVRFHVWRQQPVALQDGPGGVLVIGHRPE